MKVLSNSCLQLLTWPSLISKIVSNDGNTAAAAVNFFIKQRNSLRQQLFWLLHIAKWNCGIVSFYWSQTIIRTLKTLFIVGTLVDSGVAKITTWALSRIGIWVLFGSDIGNFAYVGNRLLPFYYHILQFHHIFEAIDNTLGSNAFLLSVDDVVLNFSLKQK